MRRSEKIFYNLKESTEYVELLETRFFFSSSFNKERFLKGYETFVKEEKEKIEARYNVEVKMDFALIMSYYGKIEKRGHYVLAYNEETKDFDIEVI